MTRLVRLLACLPWLMDERRLSRQHHLLTGGRTRTRRQRRQRQSSHKEAAASLGTSGRQTGGAISDHAES